MSNVSEDPKVQKLIEKALKAQRKAIVDGVKSATGGLVDDAKGAESEKAVIKAMKDVAKAAVDAAKEAEVETV